MFLFQFFPCFFSLHFDFYRSRVINLIISNTSSSQILYLCKLKWQISGCLRMREGRSGGNWLEWITNGHEETLGVLGMCSTLIVVMVSHVYKCIKTFHIVCFKYVEFTVCQWYFILNHLSYLYSSPQPRYTILFIQITMFCVLCLTIMIFVALAMRILSLFLSFLIYFQWHFINIFFTMFK